MEEFKLIIGHKIKSIRELKGFSQDYVSSKLNISQNALSKIERGEIKISFDKACSLSKILETDINTLINFEPGNIFNNCNQSGVLNSYHFSDKNLINDLLETKNKLIAELEKRLNNLENS
ncbi:MAG: helix-turn-helix transcriptional regulator [Flavobacteriia bacterium]|nr:helix-turn-helix transcriptional regulator [Flavobacteriia bacterium]